MKFLRGELLAGLSLVSLLVFSPLSPAATLSAGDADGPPHLLTELKFNSTEPIATTTSVISSEISAPGWTFEAYGGGSLGVVATTAPGGSGTVDALEGSYPVPGTGGSYVGMAYNVSSLKLEDVYIDFWAKMPGVKEGCKFVKIFGERLANSGYADSTIATDYTGADYGAVLAISYGDGGGLFNDSQDIISLTGGGYLGDQSSAAVLQTPQHSDFTPSDWGTGWHHFRIHVKFNSVSPTGTRVADGEFYLEIDGKVYADATGFYNRNPANGPIQRIAFFNWAQTEPQPFQLWYYDIRISTGGFLTGPQPDPPTNVTAK